MFLAASPIRPVSTTLPVTLLQKTVPIYSRAFFDDQFQPTKSVVKGWTYIRQGVYWCDKAFDKGAKGGKVWSADLDEWRETGKAGGGWQVTLKEVEPETAPSEDEDEGEDEEDEEEEAGVVDEDEEQDETGTDTKKGRGRGKRKASKTSTPRNRARTSVAGIKPKTKLVKKRVRVTPHPKSSTSNLPATIVPEDLPTDPYERALRLLHVGATPDSLPCREEEFVDVLGRVEEGVESGGGGCLCKSA